MDPCEILKITHPEKNLDLGFSDYRDYSTITISSLTLLEKNFDTWCY